MNIKNVFISGAGALGLMYASYLSKGVGKENVYFIADDKRVEKYKNSKYYVNDKEHNFNFISNNTDLKADLIILSVKFTGIHEAIKSLRNIVKDDTIFISVMNGIESENVIKEYYGDKHLLYCEVHGMDAVKEENKIYFSKPGLVCFGSKDNKITKDVKSVEEVLKKSNLPYEIPSDIMHKMWSKLMLNDAVNQVCAVFETGYGGIQKDGKAKDMVIETMREVSKVAEAEGIILTEDEINDWMDLMCTLNPDNMPSLRQDTKAKRKTEVELFAGTIKKLGKKHAIPTPLNDYLYDKIKEIENNY